MFPLDSLIVPVRTTVLSLNGLSVISFFSSTVGSIISKSLIMISLFTLTNSKKEFAISDPMPSSAIISS